MAAALRVRHCKYKRVRPPRRASRRRPLHAGGVQGIREEVRVRRPDPRIRPPAVLRVWISATEVYLVLGATPGPVGWHDRIVDAQGFPHPQALRCHAQEHQNLKEFARTG